MTGRAVGMDPLSICLQQTSFGPAQLWTHGREQLNKWLSKIMNLTNIS
jgi:hypothetical protein